MTARANLLASLLLIPSALLAMVVGGIVALVFNPAGAFVALAGGLGAAASTLAAVGAFRQGRGSVTVRGLAVVVIAGWAALAVAVFV